jgi:hypothetical protein
LIICLPAMINMVSSKKRGLLAPSPTGRGLG